MAVFEDGLAGTTTTIGTGSYLVGGNIAGYREISQLPDGQARVFVIRTATDFEIGLYTKSGGASPSLARTTIYTNRAGGSTPVNWPVGEKTIHSTVSAAVLSALSEAQIRTADVLMRGTKLAFDLDDDSYIYAPDDDDVVHTVNGTEVLRLFNPGQARCRVQWADNGSATGPLVELLRVSSTPAAADLIGGVQWTGFDSAGNSELWAGIEGQINDPTSGSEDSQLNFNVKRAGAYFQALLLQENYLRAYPTVNNDTSGVIIGKAVNNPNVVGMELLTSGFGAFCTNNIPCMLLNRKGSDGPIISIQRENIEVGSINVAAGVVSYGTFIWHHPASERGGIVTELPVGTVMVTIDEQFEPDGPRRHLPRVAVSSRQGDRRVFGCYAGLNDDQSQMIINCGGAWQALVQGPVAGGDLLWTSNTPGVAEKQPDDIKRAATLGKCTMSDNRDQVRLVPCILEAG
jgi:hypothetical protein